MKQGICILAVALLAVACSSNDDATNQPGEADPQAAEWLLQAQQAFDQGALNVALSLTDSVKQVAPDLADLYFLRARIFTDMQRSDLAETAYRRVLERDPTYEGAWLNLANVAFREGAYGRALERYRKELAAHPSPRVWVAIGSTYEERHQADSALHAYDQAIALDSTYASAYLHLGQLHRSRGALEQAVQAARHGVRLDPENVDYQYVLGSLLVLTGDAEEAVAYLEAVIETRPWHYWATYNLGRAFANLGRQEDARHYLDRATDLQDNLEEIEYWQSLARSNPDQFMLWAKLAHALREVGRESESPEASRVALSLAPRYMVHDMEDSTAASVHRLAGTALINGNVSGAIDQYRSLLERAEDRPRIWMNLGVVYAASGRLDEAREAWEMVLRYAPSHTGTRTLLFELSQPYVPGGRTGEEVASPEQLAP